MSTPASSRNPPARAALVPRDILGAAWPLFRACLPVCLPLAVIGVAAGATPGAEAVARGEARGFDHSSEWWGVTFASIVLTLICYGAVLRQQLALAAGERVPVLDSMRKAALDVPCVLPVLLVLVVPLLPAMWVTALRGFDVVGLVLTLAGLALLAYALFAWPALVAQRLTPWAALGRSIALVRGRWREVVYLLAALAAAVFVFALLVGIFIGVVMGLAGQDVPTGGGLAFSRWLMALILCVPVVYAGAVTVTAWRTLVSDAPASRGGPALPPAT